MSRIWFAQPLETVATFWRLFRNDGVTLGFTSHDQDIWIDGVLHRASPGMVPSAIRRTGDLDADSAEVQGSLSHDSLSSEELSEGRFDGAQVRIGLIDWETGESEILYRGAMGAITEEDGGFTVELASRKLELAIDPVPRTSPGCRAVFCGPGCTLNPARFTHEAVLVSCDENANAVMLAMDCADAACIGGTVRWLDGPHAGTLMGVLAAEAAGLVLDRPIDGSLPTGLRLIVREGCDHTLDTCATRFGNAANFQGEPFLPGNDLLTRYPAPAA